MKSDSFFFDSYGGARVFAYRWLPDDEKKLKGIVQIAHGMAEHAGRYQEFAEFLVTNGFGVYANDHRGHGRTAESTGMGYFADSNGWELAVADMYRLTQIIKNEFPSTPIIVFGHSMGSFLARRFVQLHGSDIDGLILSGTGGALGIMGYIGLVLSKIEMKRVGRQGKSKLLHELSFGSYNKPFRPSRTEYDWLSRDQVQVDRYVADPLCGNISTTGLFHDLITGIMTLTKRENLEKTPRDLPIYLFSGEKDPVGKNTKGVIETYKGFKQIGVKDVTCKFYEGARHEMLNETNRQQVYQDVVQWINAHV